jgi:hypothetical protein
MSGLQKIQASLKKHIIEKFDGKEGVPGAVKDGKLNEAEFKAFLASKGLLCLVDGRASKKYPKLELSCEATVRKWYDEDASDDLKSASGYSWLSFFVAAHKVGEELKVKMQPRRLFSPLEVNKKHVKCGDDISTNTFEGHYADKKTQQRFHKCARGALGKLMRLGDNIDGNGSKTQLVFSYSMGSPARGLPIGIGVYFEFQLDGYDIDSGYDSDAYLMYSEYNQLQYIMLAQSLKHYESFTGKVPVARNELLNEESMKANVRKYISQQGNKKIKQIHILSVNVSINKHGKVIYPTQILVSLKDGNEGIIFFMDALTGKITEDHHLWAP